MLRYQSTSPLTVSLPQGADVIGDTQKDTTSLFHGPIAGSTRSYLTQNNLLDMTGDGRPDLIFEENGELWISRNVPGPSGTATFATPAQLTDGVFSTPYLEARSSAVDRFAHVFSFNKEYVWRQAIDVNGDGRIDLIDAAEQSGRWMIYLNTPGTGPSGITWIKRAYDISEPLQPIEAAGLAVEFGYLPLESSLHGSRPRRMDVLGMGRHRVRQVPVRFDQRARLHGHQRAGAGWSDAEKSFVEWEVKDINGDGYPDFVYNSSPAEVLSDGPPTHYLTHYLLRPEMLRVGLFGEPDDHPNRVNAVFNVRGLFISGPSSLTATDPFSSPIELLSSNDCGVGQWISYMDASKEYQMLACGFLDVNGDGIADRVSGRSVQVGTGYGFGTARITMPTVIKQYNTHPDHCDPSDPNYPWSYARQTTTLRDVTGDGIPDFIDVNNDVKVYIGTGTGFTGTLLSGASYYPGQPLNVEGTFAISYVAEKCDGSQSLTGSGLYDIDGDGKPEYVALDGAGHLEVYPLVGGSTWGTPEAGHLVEIDNGYGATTKITYRSAKEDWRTTHQVPFPEIVVNKIETTTSGLGDALAATHYAYGGIELFYDSTIDAFRPSGYGRSVALTTTSTPGYPSPQATATIVDRYTLELITNPMVLFAMSDRQRFGRYLIAGQVKDVTAIAGPIDVDVWSLLTVDVTTDSSRISKTNYDVYTDDTRMFTTTPSTGGDPCFEITFPYDYDQSRYFNESHYNTCTVRGFLFANARIAWRGTSRHLPTTAFRRFGTVGRSMTSGARRACA